MRGWLIIAPMKYSLRSLMLDLVLALPFLVAGMVAVYCAREAVKQYEDAQAVDKIRNSFSPPLQRR